MKNILALAFTVAFIAYSCEPAYEFRSVDDFKINQSLVENLDEMELIYSTGTPKNNNFNAFIHVMAVHKASGDTLNVLTTNNNGTGKGDNKNVFRFYFPESEEGQKYFEKYHEKDGALSASTLQSITKVVRDPRFDFMTKNNYPAVVGFLDK